MSALDCVVDTSTIEDLWLSPIGHRLWRYGIFFDTYACASVNGTRQRRFGFTFPRFQAGWSLPALGYNRAKVDGPLMKPTAAETAWTYPLCDWSCYPVEPVSVSRRTLVGAAAL